MPKNVFDNDEDLLDYNAIDAYSALRIGDDGFANVWPPPEADFLFHDQFERRAREMQRSPNNLQPVYEVRQRNGAWSGNNQLGIEQPFAPNANNEQTILKLDEWGFPEVWSVLLGITYDAGQLVNDTDGFSVNCKAIIGCGGTTQEASIDWKNGTSFSAPMNALNIIARYTASDNVPSDLRLRVQISKGKMNNFHPTNTRDIVALSGAFSNIVEIPQFAQRLYLVGSGTAFAPGIIYDAANFIKFSANSATTAGTVQKVRADQMLNFSSGYPIARFSRFLSYFNGTAGTVAGSLIFELGL